MAVNKPKKVFRQVDGRATEDYHNIVNLQYNESAGSVKATEVGGHLKPLNDGAGGFTTNAATARAVRKGTSLAIFNSSTTAVHAVTLSDSTTQAALAAGATTTTGLVGVPCAPLSWTYLPTNEKTVVRTNNAELLVFIIHDESYITSQG
jgi:hypothetical protein